MNLFRITLSGSTFASMPVLFAAAKKAVQPNLPVTLPRGLKILLENLRQMPHQDNYATRLLHTPDCSIRFYLQHRKDTDTVDIAIIMPWGCGLDGDYNGANLLRLSRTAPGTYHVSQDQDTLPTGFYVSNNSQAALSRLNMYFPRRSDARHEQGLDLAQPVFDSLKVADPIRQRLGLG